MKHLQTFEEPKKSLNENFLQKIKSALINKWEKLMAIPVRTNYQASIFGFVTDEGKISGNLWIYVERNKKKSKAELVTSLGSEEYDIDEISIKEPLIEKYVDWAFSTDLSKPLKDHIKEKFGASFIMPKNLKY